jgi:hypothetical protein
MTYKSKDEKDRINIGDKVVKIFEVIGHDKAKNVESEFKFPKFLEDDKYLSGEMILDILVMVMQCLGNAKDDHLGMPKKHYLFATATLYSMYCEYRKKYGAEGDPLSFRDMTGIIIG